MAGERNDPSATKRRIDYLAQMAIDYRGHSQPRRGQLEWHLPTPGMLSRMLHHPIYAGAYSYGRRRVDRKRTAAGNGKPKMREVPMSEWMVLERDRLPAYITWMLQP